MAVEVVDGAAAIAAEDAGGVSVVDHHDGAVFFGEIGELVDRADVAVHGEDAVGDEEFVAGLVLDFLQQLFGVGDVFVAEDLDFGAGEPGAIDDAMAWLSSSEMMKSSLPRIAETVPALAVKPDWKTTQASTFLKRGDLFFQLHVDAHGAGDGADRARARRRICVWLRWRLRAAWGGCTGRGSCWRRD